MTKARELAEKIIDLFGPPNEIDIRRVESLIEKALREAVKYGETQVIDVERHARSQAFEEAAMVIMGSGYNDSFSTGNLMKHTESLASIVRQLAGK